MPKQSLKNARLYLEDGSASASVISSIANFVCDTADTSGHFTNGSAVAQTLNAEGADAPFVQVGSVFTTGGTDYVITGISGDGSAADAVTFTGTLAAATTSVTGIVAQAANRSLEIKVGDGSLTYSEKVEREYELDRGNIDTVRDGDDQPLEVNCAFMWEWLKADSMDIAPTVRDVLTRSGLAWNWMSAASDPCEPFAVDFRVDIEAECAGSNIKNERLTFPDFRYENIDGDLSSGQVSFAGKCNTTQPVIERLASF